MKLKYHGLLALVALGLLSACVTKPASETRYYMLTAQPAADSKTMRDKPVLEIAALTLPQYLERPQIVTRPTEQRLEIHEHARWGDNLRKNLERVLAGNLSVSLGSTQVLVVPHLLPEVDYRLMLEIQRFERVPGNKVVLHAQWTLFKAGQVRPVAADKVQLSRELPAGSGMDEVVAGMSVLFGDLSERIAATLTR